MNINKLNVSEAAVIEEVTYTVTASFTFKESDLTDPETKAFFEVLKENDPTFEEKETEEETDF